MKSIFLTYSCLFVSFLSSAQKFTATDIDIHAINQGNVMWGDYDNDNDLDVFVFGETDEFGIYNTALYRNDEGTFIEVYAETFENLVIGDSDWGDYDNDGDLDIVLTGSIDSSPEGGRTFIYKNTGEGFVIAHENEINAFIGGAVEWGDFDHDGDLDLAIGGEEAASGSNNARNFEIYENEGEEFTLRYQEIDTGIYLGSTSWGDYDNDGDLDLLITGMTFGSSTFRESAIIDNTEEGFVRNENAQLIGVGLGSGEWGDFDNDGDLDILLNGNTYENNSFDRTTIIYENSSSGFEIVFKDAIVGTEEGEASWGDFDNDGDLDILVIGRSSNDFTDLHTEIYEYKEGGFEFFEKLSTGVRIGSADWGDYDNDGDLDILLSGQDVESNTISKLYVNNSGTNEFSTNVVPATPAQLNAIVTSSLVELTWDVTSEESLTFNLHLRSATDTVISSHAKNDGFRKIVNRGNTGYLKRKEMELEPGDFFWKVQTIDHSFLGSSFSDEKSFHVNFPPTITGTASSLSTFEETSLLIELSDIAVTDPDNDFPTDFVLSVLSGDNYSVSDNEITPDEEFNGTLAVSVQVNDGTDNSEIAEILLEVEPINDAPVITGTTSPLSTAEETSLLIEVSDIAVTDPDNDYPTDFVLTVLSGDNYSVSNNEITPDEDFNGTLVVLVQISDGTDDSEIVEISVAVEPVNDLPIITGTTSSFSTSEDINLLIELTDLTVIDSDNDFPSDFVLTVLARDNYSVKENEITPDENFNGTLIISVQVNDGMDNSDVAQFNVEVTPVNDPPVVKKSNISFSALQETSLAITLSDFSVEDPDNNFPTDHTLVVQEGEGYSVEDNVILPNEEVFGELEVMIIVSDGTANSEPFTFQLEIIPLLDVARGFSDAKFGLYPNPANNQLVILPKNPNSFYDAKIYDLNGLLINTFNGLKSESSLDISHYKKGIYLVQILSENQTSFMRMIKE